MSAVCRLTTFVPLFYTTVSTARGTGRATRLPHYGSDETNGKGQANVTVADSVALCSIFNSTNRIEPVFLAPFRLYCKLVRRPGQGCSSAPWAPCRMQHSYRTFTVHHGVWFCLPGFHSNAAATGSLLGGRSSAGGTMSLFLSPSGKRFYNFTKITKTSCKLGGDGLTDTNE